jgi:outer membrane protein OmpA-like peptidoglycan-associated protein
VVRQGDNITLAMPGNITFATNSADVNADFYPILDKVARRGMRAERLIVVGENHPIASHGRRPPAEPPR